VTKNRNKTGGELPEGSSEFLLYQSEDGQARIQVRLLDKTVWLTQKQIGDLYQKDVRTINEHVANVFSESELLPEATIRKFRIVQTEGGRQVERLVDFYNLDMILAVGYRVRSQRGTQFRQWVTRNLREYLVKGFVLDDERLKENVDRGIRVELFKSNAIGALTSYYWHNVWRVSGVWLYLPQSQAREYLRTS